MTIKPMGDRVLVKMEQIQEKTAGGIIIPDSAREKPVYAPVVAIGNVENIEIKVGDIVFYKKFSGTELDFERKKYIVIPYGDLLAKMVETEEI